MTAALVQLLHLAVVLAAAPLLTGLVRAAKARLQGRRGPPLVQPYRDLVRLLRKEAIVAESASWLFRAAPYLVLVAIVMAVAVVPSFATPLPLSRVADVIALVAVLGAARFFLALAGLDIGTAFGGIGASREMMFGTIAEPAMLLVVFTVAIIARTTDLSEIAAFMIDADVGLRVSLGLALVAALIVAIAENARIPVDNPATHLELTMVHEAMVLEYAGRHLAMIEAAAMLKLTLYASVLAAIFFPFGIAVNAAAPLAIATGIAAYLGKLALIGILLALLETAIAKMRVFRVAEFLAGAMLLGLLAIIYLYVAAEI